MDEGRRTKDEGRRTKDDRTVCLKCRMQNAECRMPDASVSVSSFFVLRSSFFVHRSSFIVHRPSFIVHRPPPTMTPHRTFAALAVLATLVMPASAAPQHGGGGAPLLTTAPREAAQFDFLVGQWELVVHPGVSALVAMMHGAPKMLGTWKAWRGLDGWGVEDELRITDNSGNPRSLSHAVRVYDATAHKWNSSSLDVYRGTFASSTGEWKDNQMTATSRGVDSDGKAYVTRTRYYDITPVSFRVQQDRSFDDGKTWTQGVLKIEAKRVSGTAPR